MSPLLQSPNVTSIVPETITAPIPMQRNAPHLPSKPEGVGPLKQAEHRYLAPLKGLISAWEWDAVKVLQCVVLHARSAYRTT